MRRWCRCCCGGGAMATECGLMRLTEAVLLAAGVIFACIVIAVWG